MFANVTKKRRTANPFAQEVFLWPFPRNFPPPFTGKLVDNNWEQKLRESAVTGKRENERPGKATESSQPNKPFKIKLTKF